MRTLCLCAFVLIALGGCSGEDPTEDGPQRSSGDPALSSDDPAVAGPAIFEEITRAMDEGDVEALFEFMTRKELEEGLDGAQGDLDRIRDKPRQLAAAQEALKLDRSPLELSRREWAKAILRSQLTRRADSARAQFGTKFVSAHLDRGRLILVAEGSAPGADGKPSPHPREHVFVREDGTWRRSEEASWEYANGIHSVLYVEPGPAREGDDEGPQRHEVQAPAPGTEAEGSGEPRGHAQTLVFSPDGRHLVSADSLGVIVWDWKRGTKLREIPVREVTKLAFHPDGRWLATDGPDLTLWDIASGRKLKTLVPSEEYDRKMAVSPDGRHVATARGGTIHLWDPDTGKRRVVVDESATVMKLAFLGTEHLVSLVWGKVRVHDLAGTRILVIPHPSADFSHAALAVSPGGDRIALKAREDQVEVFDAQSGRRVAAIDNRGARALRFSPSGRVLALGSTGVSRWDVETQRLVRIHHCLRPGGTIGYSVARGSEGPLAYHPSGKILATAFAAPSGPTITLLETED